MTNRQVETSREIRLWITGIVGPAVLAAGTIIAGDPELRAQFVGWTKKQIKRIKDKLRKKEGEQNA